MRNSAVYLFRALVVAGVLTAGSAAAATYDFDVLYSGNNNASLATGSADPTTTAINPGDSFVYSLTAQNGGFWTTISSGSIFPSFAFYVSEAASRTSDFTFELLDQGVVVFSDVQAGAVNQAAHLGTNTETLPAGLIFDEFLINDALTSAFAIDSTNTVTTATTTSTPLSILPFGGAPEHYSPTIISYSVSAAPEPATWSLSMMGVGLIGLALRSRRGRARQASLLA